MILCESLLHSDKGREKIRQRVRAEDRKNAMTKDIKRERCIYILGERETERGTDFTKIRDRLRNK